MHTHANSHTCTIVVVIHAQHTTFTMITHLIVRTCCTCLSAQVFAVLITPLPPSVPPSLPPAPRRLKPDFREICPSPADPVFLYSLVFVFLYRKLSGKVSARFQCLFARAAELTLLALCSASDWDPTIHERRNAVPRDSVFSSDQDGRREVSCHAVFFHERRNFSRGAAHGAPCGQHRRRQR